MLTLHTSESIDQITPALIAAQKALKPVRKTSDAQYGKYADLHSTLESIHQALHAQDMVILQPLCCDGDEAAVVTRLLHTSGQWIEGSVPLRTQGLKGPQEMGSLITYMRRYSAQAIMGLAAEDDDGQAAHDAQSAAPRPAPAHEEYLASANALLKDLGEDKAKEVLAAVNIPSLKVDADDTVTQKRIIAALRQAKTAADKEPLPDPVEQTEAVFNGERIQPKEDETHATH